MQLETKYSSMKLRFHTEQLSLNTVRNDFNSRASSNGFSSSTSSCEWHVISTSRFVQHATQELKNSDRTKSVNSIYCKQLNVDISLETCVFRSLVSESRLLSFMGCGQAKEVETTTGSASSPAAKPVENNNSAMAAPRINFPAENSPQRASSLNSLRPKVPLKPGRSLMDWIRLGNSGKDLAGVGGNIRRISVEELSKHNREDDVWIAVRGKKPWFEWFVHLMRSICCFVWLLLWKMV